MPESIPAEVSAAFVIRLETFEEAPPRQYAVGGVFGTERMTAGVSFETIVGAPSEEWIAAEVSIAVGLDGAAPDWFKGVCIPSVSPGPLTLVTVALSPIDLRSVWSVSEGAGVKDKHKTFDLYATILDCASKALALAFSRVDVAQGGWHATAGPISHGDLVGEGLLRIFVPETDENWYQRLPSRAPLGSKRLAIQDVLDEGIEGPVSNEVELHLNLSGAVDSSRRLGAWLARSQLRFSRGEWPEAVVAIEASCERLIWHLLELVLLDHGWRAENFKNLDSQKMAARSALRCLHGHFGGRSEEWDQAEGAFELIFQTRNEVVHRGREIVQEQVERVDEARVSLARFLEERYRTPTVARRHPLLVTVTLGREIAGQLLGSSALPDRILESSNSQSMLRDLRHLHDERATGVPAPSPGEKASMCWPSGGRHPQLKEMFL